MKMPSALTKNLGLKLLSLALAIVLYYTLKPGSQSTSESNHDARSIQHP